MRRRSEGVATSGVEVSVNRSLIKLPETCQRESLYREDRHILHFISEHIRRCRLDGSARADMEWILSHFMSTDRAVGHDFNPVSVFGPTPIKSPLKHRLFFLLPRPTSHALDTDRS
ncbi:hypothetical protein EVAR_89444_1 [Eumeta japonica]|uniref:Uncharacterized protein n=1 Tax=Eumeta variegata TaxID=151549 RepID=A0A4C1Z664_EUMVA|nr:hypothetical protein EVAR_89444_1 [Eumeta japonica]